MFKNIEYIAKHFRNKVISKNTCKNVDLVLDKKTESCPTISHSIEFPLPLSVKKTQLNRFSNLQF